MGETAKRGIQRRHTRRAAATQANISRNVKVYMAERGIRSQVELAALTGLHQTSISKALAGVRRWSLDDLDILAEQFDVPVSLLLEDTLVRNRCFPAHMSLAA
jgi:transcriptional regulator with XRE-family HTH domain